MKKLRSSFTFLQLLYIYGISMAIGQEITFQLVEENQKGVVLGNLNYLIKNFMNSDPKIIDFHIASKYFDIDNISKNVFLKATIDLDTLCLTDSECCYKEVCIIETKVLVQEHKQYKMTFLLKVEIKDVDDNLPVFPDDKQVIQLLERIRVNTTISIDGATDKDFSKAHQKKLYQFYDDTSTFQLSSHDSETLSIVVMKPLDYETKQKYYCALKACDRTSQNCITKAIIVEIIDENDNEPIFEKKLYQVKIPENYPIGKKIITVYAKDADGPAYNKTNYGFRNDNYLKSIFSLDKHNGAISLRTRISINKRSRYKFTVYAIDALSITFKKDYTDVEIDIEDVNDNHPIISLLHGPMPELYSIQIPENSPPRELFSIHISDKDLGLNSVVNCTLSLMKEEYLDMVKVDQDIYNIRTVTSFDYESLTTIEAEIICADSGTPSLTTKKMFNVNIIDINEYPPQMKNSLVKLTLKENLPPNKFVLQVIASDQDRNAALTYSLDEIGKQYFFVDPQNGEIITSNVVLDKETTDSVQFKVFVTDSLENPYTATSLVTVYITDQNDNAPQFIYTVPFVISENQYVYTKLSTKIEATDADKEEINRSVIFRLLHTFNSKMEMIHDQVFDVNWKGEIETLAIIDREKDNNFTLSILAQDKGNPPKSNTTNITITVLDINDNPPTWIYPDSHLSSEPEAVINVSKEVSIGTVIANLKAFDVDLDDAGKVSYLIISSDTYHQRGNFLVLNETSGLLSVFQYPLTYGKNIIRIRAHDHGQPQLHKDANLIINVMQPNDNLFSGLNMAIIIGMLSITALISIFLVIAIFFIRRSPNLPRNQRLSNQSVNKDLQNSLKLSYKDLVDFNDKKESVFTDNDCHHVYYRNGNLDSSLSMYPQSSVEGSCQTYVRFALPGSFIHEMDGESADSGKGTSDLDVAHQTNMKASTTNLYGNIQLIPSTRVNYFVPNKNLRRSYQVINEAEQTYSANTFQTQPLSSNIHNPETIPKLCSYQTLSFSTLPPYET